MKELCFYGADRTIKTNKDKTPKDLLDEIKDELSEEQYQSLKIILTFKQ
jgi:hypothetical protein